MEYLGGIYRYTNERREQAQAPVFTRLIATGKLQFQSSSSSLSRQCYEGQYGNDAGLIPVELLTLQPRTAQLLPQLSINPSNGPGDLIPRNIKFATGGPCSDSPPQRALRTAPPAAPPALPPSLLCALGAE